MSFDGPAANTSGWSIGPRREELVRLAAPSESSTLCPLAAMPWQRPNIGSRMNREVHVRFRERLRVKLPRATRQSRHFGRRPAPSGLPGSTDIVRPPRHVGLVAQSEREIGATAALRRGRRHDPMRALGHRVSGSLDVHFYPASYRMKHRAKSPQCHQRRVFAFGLPLPLGQVRAVVRSGLRPKNPPARNVAQDSAS
jgi:hypothetical protein